MSINKQVFKSKIRHFFRQLALRPRLWRSWSKRQRVAYVCWLFTNFIIAVGLVASSYAGYLDPERYTGAGIVVMTLPIWVILAFLILIANLIWWRLTSVGIGLVILCCAGPIWDLCPLNLPHGKLSASEQARSFTLMTYNTFYMVDRDNDGSVPNQTLEYILNQDADIVCLQETNALGVSSARFITDDQITRLDRQYPYKINRHSVLLLSKYPASSLPIDLNKVISEGCDMDGYLIEVKGKKIVLFNCHFQSLMLNDHDKALYTRLTELEADEESVDEVKDQLLTKIMIANRKRARQVRMIGQYLGEYEGENLILCGDFNDVPGCYTLHYLNRYGLDEVYPQIGFGPSITYNANRLYFRIDHIMYRGAFKPVDITRGALKSSDHYPQIVTFVLDK